MFIEPKNREEWLKERQRGIGGSDAAAAIGMNPYKSNVDLWEEKTGRVTPKDILDNHAIMYGKQAEAPLRELFKLDFPEYDVKYSEFGMYVSDTHPFMYATLDGELTNKSDGTKGVFECKTTTIQNASQWAEWDGKVPQHYYIQLLHQLWCTHFDFAILKAHIRYYKGDDICATTRHYRIETAEVMPDIVSLVGREWKFWQYVTENKIPPLILPKI